MNEKLKQISDLAREVMVDVQDISKSKSKLSSMKTMCQSILDAAYTLDLEIERAKCDCYTPETFTTQAE
jgi:hypothetical protein